jgi:hypothetical protein
LHIVGTSIRRAQRFMSSYRFYSHDRLGRLVDRRELQCRDDADALAVAGDLNHTFDVEIWLGLRRVARIPRRSQRAGSSTYIANEDAAPPSMLDKIRLV